MNSEGNLKSVQPLNTWQAILLSLVLLTTVAFGYAFYLKNSHKKVNDDGEIDYENWRSTSVSSLFESAKQEETEARIVREYVPPPIPAKQKEKAAQKPLTPERAFLVETPQKTDSLPPPNDQKNHTEFYQAQAQLAASRRGGGQFEPLFPQDKKKLVSESSSVSGGDELGSKESEEGQDEDFSKHSMPKDTSTLPVDLTRTITTDRYIPCILIDQIHSQLSGQAVCQVENNVFGYHGRKLLIPAGSRVVGRHETLDKVGMERFELQWQRIIRPDGAHILLSDAYASDMIGQSGVSGHIDNRMFDKYGAALITATMSTLMQTAMSTSYENTDITNSVVDNFGTDLGQVTAAMLADTVNIKPFSVVKAGTRLFIRPQTDIWLQETEEGEWVFAKKEDK